MAYVFENDHVYHGGLSGTDLINILQDKYGILNNFDAFVNSYINRGIINDYIWYDEDTVHYEMDEFLTRCFQDYILTQSTGVVFKGDKFPLVETGNLVLNTIVRMID